MKDTGKWGSPVRNNNQQIKTKRTRKKFGEKNKESSEKDTNMWEEEGEKMVSQKYHMQKRT